MPLRVKSIKKGKFIMETGRAVEQAFAGKVKVGDYLICQQDMAVEKVNQTAARAMRQAIKGVSDEQK